MLWVIVLLGYLLGSTPTAYIAGRLLKGKDIRQMGDGNVGARNAFRELGAKVGIAIFFVDATKGVLAILIAQAANIPQIAILFTGAAAVVGHNWPVFIGFRGGPGGEYYHWGPVSFNHTADANLSWTSDSHPIY